MPDHGHGTPITVNVTPMAAAGQYQLDPVNLWMPGYWETTVEASQTNGLCTGSTTACTAATQVADCGAGVTCRTTDAAVFKFCIPD